jgi:pimeloyl-ACP methyl ester carboxylesterase
MKADEMGACARLGGHVFAGVSSRVEGVHRAVAGRVFGATGAAGLSAQTIHDHIAGAVYGGLRFGGLTAGAIASEVVSRVLPSSASPAGTALGNQALAALNGFVGHRLVGDLAPLAIPMAVRAHGRDVDLTGLGVAAAFPGATSKLAVFVHGLAETENLWTAKPTDDGAGGYGSVLKAELGYTPLYIRYNTGRHVSENGRSLARLLGDLVSAWPVPPEEVLLVGHSMGGLVIRSACHYGAGEGQAWVPLVRHIVYLGTPHLGAPLAKAAGLAGWTLSRLPETAPFAPLFNGSSDGVKDLRFGYLVDDDWSGCDPDQCTRDHRHEVPLLEAANHYVISATITSDPNSPLGGVIGDLLVQPASAHGRRRRRQHVPFVIEHGRSLGGLTHFHLVNHPQVWDQIRGLLQPPNHTRGRGQHARTAMAQ